ncbi:MAG: NRDE family protein [Betaproteobacteria bacterium]|nr:MAG: NRDE family protein [Betaproteobacteria bacterium]
MCIAVFRWAPESAEPLVLASNRDEFFERPTLPMHWWPGEQLLAGKDLRNDGTWLGATRSGRFALLTNVRDPSQQRVSPPSRGLLVRDFLCGNQSPQAFLDSLALNAAAFQGFNILCGTFGRNATERALWFFNSTEASARRLPAGDYAISNATLDTPWPKVRRLKRGFVEALNDESIDRERRLVDLLNDNAQASDELLPATGIPIAMERALSAVFIRCAAEHGQPPNYGTRASTLVAVDGDGVRASEMTHTAERVAASRVQFEFSFDV